MKNALFCALLVASAVSASAQQAAAPASFADTLKMQYTSNKGFLLASAEKWPEDAYAWRPAGLQAELRTFGQILVHIANENNQVCSRLMGKPVPTPYDDNKGTFTKAEATKALKDAFTVCDPVYAALTNETIVQMVPIAGRGNTPRMAPRGTTLVANVAHSNEQYGMVMVYFGMRGAVPPSHEPK
jgi:hypothetical protein